MENNTNPLPELLAPAGGTEQLRAAVENGADAVYLGGRLFNARQNASNFTMEELRKAVEYAHIRGVDIHAALNTLISDSEMQEALEYANNLYEMGIDALIVQDLGFAARLKNQLPDLALHFSTQGTIFNKEGVFLAERLGMERVVLARELSIGEIRAVVQEASIDIEVFIHGALCQCYSGQCHLSNAIGGRSGNRGVCAQPCRLPYTIVRENGHSPLTAKGNYLSPKDLCALQNLPALVATGIKSLKIEGRMKSPEYVAVVTGIYRKYLDFIGAQGGFQIDPCDERDLRQVYNRGGFTTGYLISRPGRDLITRGRPKHWGTYLGKVAGRNPKRRSLDILLAENLSLGDGVEIDNKTLPGNIVTMMRIKDQKAVRAMAGDTVTIGYIDGNVNIGDPVYKITDKELNRKAGETFSGKSLRKVLLAANLTVEEGRPLRFSVSDPEGMEVAAVGDFIPETAVNRALTAEAAENQIKKTGGTPFIIGQLSCRIQPGLSVPLSELNSVRREALEKLADIRADRYPDRARLKASSVEHKRDSKYFDGGHLNSAYLYRWEDLGQLTELAADSGNHSVLKAEESGIGRVYLPFRGLLEQSHRKAIASFKKAGIQVFAAIPPITKGAMDEELRLFCVRLEGLGIDGILLGNVSHVEMFANYGLPMFGDYSFNVYNSDTVKVAADLGLKGLTLSHELSPDQLRKIRSYGIQLEATVSGRIPVMISEHCPIGSELSDKPAGVPCNLCVKGGYSLKDRTGAEFPMLGDPQSCRCTILDSKIRRQEDYMEALSDSEITVFRRYI